MNTQIAPDGAYSSSSGGDNWTAWRLDRLDSGRRAPISHWVGRWGQSCSALSREERNTCIWQKSVTRAVRRIFTVSAELFWRCPHRIACLNTSNQWVQFLLCGVVSTFQFTRHSAFQFTRHSRSSYVVHTFAVIEPNWLPESRQFGGVSEGRWFLYDCQFHCLNN